MTPLQAAQRALPIARESLSKLGAANILKSTAAWGGKGEHVEAELRDGPAPKQSEEQIAFMERKLHLDMAFAQLTDRGDVMNAGVKKFAAYGRSAAGVGAGNCQEYAAVACAALSTIRGVPKYDAVYLVDGNHVFTAVGQDHDGEGDYPRDLNRWSATAAICDPWANIACLASNYSHEWRQVLRGWNANGWRLKGAANDVALPTDAEWYDAVENCAKKSYTYRPGQGGGKCCYIATATCRSLGLGDDCPELQLLRRFRDEVVLTTTEGRREVRDYYAIAPAAVAAMSRCRDSDAVYSAVYKQRLEPALAAIQRNDVATARRIFRDLLRDLRALVLDVNSQDHRSGSDAVSMRGPWAGV